MKKYIILPLLALLALSAQAKVRLSHLVGDNMVLQQQTEARLWGWAKPGAQVKVTVSWSGDVTTVMAAKDGSWLAKVRTPKASYGRIRRKADRAPAYSPP